MWGYRQLGGSGVVPSPSDLDSQFRTWLHPASWFHPQPPTRPPTPQPPFRPASASAARFRPAPLYILDEVDAALDMSHTQNIGRMIKEHFPESQFIIVSLKEGMFNHANVLFRTRFLDGVSSVTRTQNAAGGHGAAAARWAAGQGGAGGGGHAMQGA